MPIYEYRCEQCGRVTEVIQKVGARPLRKCATCSGRLKKLISRTSFLLKGGGWYAEGYSKTGKTESTEAKSGDAKATKTKTESKGEKKTASA